VKICFVCSEYPPGPHGGLGTFTQVMARALVRAGHQARVVGLYSPDYPGAPYGEDQGVQVWRLAQPTWRCGWVLGRYRLFQLIATWAEQGDIDLVEVPDWGGPAAMWPRLPVPVVARLNGSATYFAQELGRPFHRVTFWLERASLRRALAWCSASQYTADKTRRLFGLRTGPDAILANPVELPAEDSTPARSHNQVVFTGTLTEKKGVLSLVRAWPQVAKQCPDAELHIFGKDGRAPDGSSMQAYLHGQLGNGLAGTVQFHGHQPREVLFGALARAAVAVFPSYSEAFGIAPFEAMAQGCPTIYSRCGPGLELVRDGVDGLLVDPADPSDIARAIARVLGDPDLGSRLGETGRERVREKFCIDAQFPLNEAFYRRYGAASGNRATRAERSVAIPVDAHRAVAGSPDGPRAEAEVEREKATNVAAWLRLGKGGDRLPDLAETVGDLTQGVTVAICTYKRAASLSRLLDSLVAQGAMPNRVIIVDASPDDDTERTIREHATLAGTGADVLYFRVAGPLRGLTRQRNFALRWVATDLVAFFDDDVVLCPACWLELERHHRQQGTRMAGVGALIENQFAAPRLLWRMRAWLRVVSDLRPGTYSRSGISIPWSFLPATEEGLVEGEWLPGGATMWRTALAREIGFNEEFTDYCSAEDLDVSLRMRARGALAVAGRARVLHLHDDSGRPDAFELGYMNARNSYDIHRRCLAHRTWMDEAYFVYALAVDTLLYGLALLKPARIIVRWRFVRGRLRFLTELLLGRSG